MRMIYILLIAASLALISGCINPLIPTTTPSPSPIPTKTIEPEVSANLSVGYLKVFAVVLDGINYTMTETHPSIFVYRFMDGVGNKTIYVDENSSVLKVVAQNYTIRYKNPLPTIQYPLIKGQRWYYLSPITVTYENRSVDGQTTVNGTVERFENVTIFNNTTYQTAVVKQTTVTSYNIDKTNYSVSNESTLWYGQDVGLIKSYTISKIYVENSLDQISDRQQEIIEFKQQDQSQ